MVAGQTAQQCCYLEEQKLHYSQPGNQILYYRKEAQLQCKKGRSGTNCDACAQQWSGVNCDACAPGWACDDCDTCADGFLNPTCDQICDGFGCCNHDNCQGCIQNGVWEGPSPTSPGARLTFRGKTFSDLVPGW